MGAICGGISMKLGLAICYQRSRRVTSWPSNVSLSFLVLRLARIAGWHYTGGSLPLVALQIRPWLSSFIEKNENEKGLITI